MHVNRFSTVLVGLLSSTTLLYGCAAHPSNPNDRTNTPSQPQSPPYDFSALLGFQPALPSKTFQLKQMSSYVFKYVNPPWGKVNPKVMETWGNGTAYDAMYDTPNTGKSFTVMETEIGSHHLPNVGSPWTTIQKNGETLYKNDVKGFGKIVATIKQHVLYVVTYSYNKFTPAQLEQILESLSQPVRKAPQMIKTQTFGFKQAPTAVPFTALLPSKLPFKWDTRTASGVDVKSPRRTNNRAMGRLILTYSHGQSRLKILEGLGIKYVNPNVAKAPNGVKTMLRDGNEAVYMDGGSSVSLVDGGSPNRKVLTWTLNNGVNLIVVGSMNLSKSNLLQVANSLATVKAKK